jgi:hypothetical protein
VTWSWTQPCCMGCFDRLRPAAEPVRLKAALVEVCCYCGHDTAEGIYVRVNPATVRWPTRTT